MSVPYFVLWKWLQPGYHTSYTAEHVNTMVWMMRKHDVPLDRIVCVTDDPSGVHCRTYPIWGDHSGLPNVSGPRLPSCYRRLKLFDPETQAQLGIAPGERIVSIDLDALILQKFLGLFEGFKEDFVGWKVPGSRHRIVLNGSMWMLTAGKVDWLWTGFNPSKSPQAAVAKGYMGSDQGYLSHQLVEHQDIGGWTAAGHGVLSYQRDILQLRVLPRHTRIVFFPGKFKPWDPAVQKRNDWIKRYMPKPEEIRLNVHSTD